MKQRTKDKENEGYSPYRLFNPRAQKVKRSAVVPSNVTPKRVALLAKELNQRIPTDRTGNITIIPNIIDPLGSPTVIGNSPSATLYQRVPQATLIVDKQDSKKRKFEIYVDKDSFVSTPVKVCKKLDFGGTPITDGITAVAGKSNKRKRDEPSSLNKRSKTLPQVLCAERSFGPISITAELLDKWRGKKRSRNQNTTMGYNSASALAAQYKLLEAGKYWEWLHISAFSFGGLDGFEPQVSDNLVGGTYESNTSMINAENAIRYLLCNTKAEEVLLSAKVTYARDEHGNLTNFADMLVYSFQVTGKPNIYTLTYYPTEFSPRPPAVGGAYYSYITQSYVENEYGTADANSTASENSCTSTGRSRCRA